MPADHTIPDARRAFPADATRLHRSAPRDLRLLALMASVVAVSIAVVACHDAPTAAARGTTEAVPQFTLGSGVTNLTLVRSHLGTIKVNSKFNDFKAKLAVDDDADIVVNNNSMVADGTSGWHTHPGITIIAIKSGALTFYDADDPLCRATIYSAGQVAVESGGHAHIARNEGAVGAEWFTTYVVPAGGATRVDAPAPGTCPF